MLRRLVLLAAGALLALALGATPVMAATNPSGTGPPDQSCQDQLTSGGMTPGNSANSPGSPFDEPGFGPAPNGGIGGQNYSENSQYDVACFQVSQPH